MATSTPSPSPAPAPAPAPKPAPAPAAKPSYPPGESGPSSAAGTSNPDARLYNQDGSLKTEDQLKETPAPEDCGPPGMPAAAASDAPFSTKSIPNGWARFPTDEEVSYLNKKYPAASE